MASRSVIVSMAFMLLGVSQADILGFVAKQYSTNAICRQSNCINPIFPGMEDLRRLEATELQCQTAHDAKQHMQFCKNAVYYDVALPSPTTSSNTTTLQSVVLLQDNAASTMYYYHLAGMNVEGWENRHPDQTSDACTKAIWKMVCHTYFPRAEAGCKQSEPTKHLRPCKNVCGSYLQSCNVECCDESVQCVFSKKAALIDGSETTESGYHDELGPSASCTGAASRKSYPSVAVLSIASLALLQFFFPGCCSARTAAANAAGRAPSAGLKKYFAYLVLFFVCTSLQGCVFGQLFSHPVPTWEQIPNYWTKFQYIPEGAPVSKKIYNSCEMALPLREQCSGNGECEAWRPNLKAASAGKEMLFCKCYRDWADPECRTTRKSQLTAFSLSVFFGFFGADQYYLGHYITGCIKVATLSGALAGWYMRGWWVLTLLSYVCGMWWVFDIVRIGSSPVYAAEYRVAYDLPHWLYVSFTLTFFTLLGYIFFGVLTRATRFEKAKNRFLMHEEEQHQALIKEKGIINPEDMVGMPTLRSYGLPTAVNCYGAVPDEVRQGSAGADEYNSYSAYGVFHNAMKGYSSPNRYDERLQPRNLDYERSRMASGQMNSAHYGNPYDGY